MIKLKKSVVIADFNQHNYKNINCSLVYSVQCKTFIMLCLGFIGMDHDISEPLLRGNFTKEL